MKKVICLFLLLFIPSNFVDAKCMYNDIANLKKMAANVNYSYEYKITNNDAIFNITLTNLVKDIYFIDTNKNKTYQNKKGELILKNYKSGDTVIYNFYPNDPDCLDTPLYTLRIVLPKYNEFYTQPICKGAEEYSLCQKWSSHNLDLLTFKSKVEQYKNSKSQIVNENPSEDTDDNSVFHYIIIFLVNYYYVIILLGGGIVMIIAYLKNKRNSIYS